MKTIPFVILVLGMVSAVSLGEQTQKPPDDRRLGVPWAIGREKRLWFAVRDENWRLVHGDQRCETSEDPGEKKLRLGTQLWAKLCFGGGTRGLSGRAHWATGEKRRRRTEPVRRC